MVTNELILLITEKKETSLTKLITRAIVAERWAGDKNVHQRLLIIIGWEECLYRPKTKPVERYALAVQWFQYWFMKIVVH